MTTAVHEHPGAPLHHRDPSAAAHEYRELERDHERKLSDLRHKRALLYAGGRGLLSAVFIVSALYKASAFRDTSEAMANVGLTDTPLLLSLAIFIELVCGAMLALGLKARVGAGMLIGYLAMVTLLVNHDLSIELNRSVALSNLAFIGGLLMVVGHGSGAISVDKLIARWQRRHI